MSNFDSSDLCQPVVSPTVCSPTTRVDSPTSNMAVRLRLNVVSNTNIQACEYSSF